MESTDITAVILTSIRDEIRTTNSKLDATIERLDTTIERLDTTIERLDTTIERLDTTIERVDVTNQRLDTTIHRLDTTIVELAHLGDQVAADARQTSAHFETLHATMDEILAAGGSPPALERRVERCERDIAELKQRKS